MAAMIADSTALFRYQGKPIGSSLSSRVAESLLCCLPGGAEAGSDRGPRLAGLAGPDDRGGEFGFGGA
jgi:hypothetical protein